jgi:hypothetical protein
MSNGFGPPCQHPRPSHPPALRRVVTERCDRYGHLMPGNEDEAAALLDAYLDAQIRRLVWLSCSASVIKAAVLRPGDFQAPVLRTDSGASSMVHAAGRVDQHG